MTLRSGHRALPPLIGDDTFRVFGYRGHRRRSRSRSHGADDADDYVPLWKKSFPLDRMIPSSHPVLISLLLFLVFLGELFSLTTRVWISTVAPGHRPP